MGQEGMGAWIVEGDTSGVRGQAGRVLPRVVRVAVG